MPSLLVPRAVVSTHVVERGTAAGAHCKKTEGGQTGQDQSGANAGSGHSNGNINSCHGGWGRNM